MANSCVAPEVSLKLYIFSDHRAWLGILICRKHRVKEEKKVNLCVRNKLIEKCACTIPAIIDTAHDSVYKNSNNGLPFRSWLS